MRCLIAQMLGVSEYSGTINTLKENIQCALTYASNAKSAQIYSAKKYAL